jgi:putative heme-binding domain-containing protein
VTGGIDDKFLLPQLLHRSEYIRAWAVQLLCEDGSPPADALELFVKMGAADEAAIVRLYLACALQRLPARQRWAIATVLASRAEDADDQNLPLMIWYGIEPLAQVDALRLAELCRLARIPLVLRHIARRVASMTGAESAVDELVKLAAEAKEESVLRGLLEGFEGRRSVAMPKLWPAAYATLSKDSLAIQEQALQLALIFDDPTALAALRAQAADTKGSAQLRRKAIEALVGKKPKDLATLLMDLVSDEAVQSAALRGLAEYDHPQTAQRLLAAYGSLDSAARQDALQTLASRPAWAMALLDAVDAKQVPRSDLSAFTARQLQSLGHTEISARVQSLWGELRATPADKSRQIAGLKRRLMPETMRQSDRSAGRALFAKNCANCHKLFDAGGAIGPEITGAQRTNLDYLLENLIDPSAAISRDFQMQIIQTTSGRVITGLAVAENENAVTIQTVNEKVVVPRGEIDERATSTVSMMPDRMLDKLSFEEIRDLIAYLSSPGQVPLPEGITSPRQ